MGRSPRRSGRKVKQRILYGQPGAPSATPQSQSKKTGETPESGSDEGEEEEEGGGGGHEEAGYEQFIINLTVCERNEM